MGRRFVVVAAVAVVGWMAFSLFGPGDVASAQADGDTVCTADGNLFVWQDEAWAFVQECDPSGAWPVFPQQEETLCVPDGIEVLREYGRWRLVGYCDSSGTPLRPVPGVSACLDEPGWLHVFPAWCGRCHEGCNPPTNDRFRPNSTVSRGQIAAFLHRALDR